MQVLRDRFIGTVEDTARTAVGVFWVWIQGGVAYRKFEQSTLSAYIELKRDENTPIAYTPTHEQIIAMLDRRPHMIVDVFHGLAIQQWHEFLADIFRAAVRAALDASNKVNLRKVDLTLRLDRLGTAALPDAVADAARDDFDRDDNDGKFERVARMLTRWEALQEPAIVAHRATIKENVLVRNVLQHAGGVVRPYDVERNGGPFVCDSGKATHRIGAGQDVHRTIFDLERCVTSMVAVARALVP
jgi:hypothetical protein